VASETCALDLIGATPCVSSSPANLLRIQGSPPESDKLAVAPGAAPQRCIFEPGVLLAPRQHDLWALGLTACAAPLGRELARGIPRRAPLRLLRSRLVNAMALGFAEQSALKLEVTR